MHVVSSTSIMYTYSNSGLDGYKWGNLCCAYLFIFFFVSHCKIGMHYLFPAWLVRECGVKTGNSWRWEGFHFSSMPCISGTVGNSQDPPCKHFQNGIHNPSFRRCIMGRKKGVMHGYTTETPHPKFHPWSPDVYLTTNRKAPEKSNMSDGHSLNQCFPDPFHYKLLIFPPSNIY